MIVLDIYRLEVKRNHGLILSNVSFNNYCKLYSPRSNKEPTQKLLKLIDSLKNGLVNVCKINEYLLPIP